MTHRLRPSNRGRVERCPGCIGMANWLAAEEPENPGAAEGSRLHAITATFMDRWLSEDAPEDVDLDQLAREVSDAEDDRELLLSCASVVEPHVPYLKAHVCEHRVDIPYMREGGTLDLGLDCRHPRDGAYRVIVDWKFWHQEIDRQDGEAQTESYWLADGADKTTAIIHLPRLGITEYYEFDPESRARALADLRDDYENTLRPDFYNLLRPSPEACRYCPARHGCPAVDTTTRALALAGQQELVSIQRFAEFVKWAPVIEDRIKVARNAVKAFILAGGEVPGFVVSEQKGRRYLTPEGCMEALERLDDYSIEVDGSDDAFRVSAGKLIDAAVDACPEFRASTKKAKRKLVEDILEPYMRSDGPTYVLRRTKA